MRFHACQAIGVLAGVRAPMLAVRRFSLAGSLLLLWLIGCDTNQPVAPAVQAALAGTAGPTVKAPSSANAVAVSADQINVSWQDNSLNETGFEVHRSASGPAGTFTLRASAGANVTSYGDVGLTPSTEYCYKVRAFKTFDGKTSYSAFSTPACATTPAPPAPTVPSGTDAKPGNSTAVDLRWIDNSTTEDGFRVERSLDAGVTWTSAGQVGPNVTSSFDGGRTSEQPVCYRVIAFNRGGDSPPSNTDCTTPPAAPTGLAATGLNGPAIDLAWADHSLVEDGYEVLRATDGVTFSAVAGLPANSTGYHDVAVSSTTTYWYEVRAKKDGGFSDFSNVASATAGNCVPTSSTEVCGNGLDDDCNGLIDAADPACQLTSACAPPVPGCTVTSFYEDCTTPTDDDCDGKINELDENCMSCGIGCPGGFVCTPFDDRCVEHCCDGALDGDEGDIDCGGSCATACKTGQHCNVNSDCASGSCVGGICQP